MIEIELNGMPYHLDGGTHVQALVEALGLTKHNLAIAVNRHVLPKSIWAQHQLQENDRVDVVRAIGGG